MVTTTIATLKGGQSKTFLSALLCRSLASMDKRVLAISVDAQNNLFLYLGGDANNYQLYDAIKDNSITGAITKTNIANVDYVHNDIDNSENVDQFLQTIRGGESRLKLLLTHVQDKYDHVILDTGPNLAVSTVAAIIASDYLISPVHMTECGLDGLIATRNALNEMLEFELTSCKNLGIVRSCVNVNRDQEAFDVEAALDKAGYDELGILLKSSSLKYALKDQADFSTVSKKHLVKTDELVGNILNQIA